MIDIIALLSHRPTSRLFDVYIIGLSTSCHSIYIYAIYDIVDVGIHTHSCVLIGLLGFHLDGVSRLISPGNREPRHCSLLSAVDEVECL